MIPFAFKHLRGNVIRSSTYSPLAFPLELQLSSQSKVSNLDIELRINEYVSQFEVTMDDLLLVDVFDAIDDA